MRFLWLCLLAPVVVAQNPRETRGYEYFYNLRYDEAIQEFRQLSVELPNNPSGFNHLAQAILYRDMFRAGALESELVTGNNPFLRRRKVDASPEDQRQFDTAIRRAMSLAQARIDKNQRDAEALYDLGVSYGLRANYNFLVRKAWRDSLKDATTARKCHNKVTEIDPSFVDARMVQALHEYIVGSLPFHWRVLGFLAGFRGNKEEGLRLLEMVAQKGVRNRLDARILLCAVYRREKQSARAIPLLEELIRTFPQNYLFPMELSQMYSDLGDKEKALAPLRALAGYKQAHPEAYPQLKPERILFAEGTIQFWYDDLDAALGNMQRAAAAAEELDLNTGVLAWMRVGQIYDLKGERKRAVAAYRQAMAYAPDSDAAKESRHYLSSPYRRKKG